MFDRYLIHWKGVIIATTIISLWFVILSFLLNCEVKVNQIFIIILAIFIQTFLNTGLFITAHEAMHGLVCPHNLTLNRYFGILAIFLYGLFSYPKLLCKHWLHHRYPATIKDPDFHDGNNAHCIAWYVHFLKGYWNWRQFSSCAIFISLICYVFELEPINLILFWALPLILSSWQLFYFGTFLPHRQPPEGYDNFHRANSSNFSVICSFLSCYHFGYHREHHEHPDLPWWQLPQIHFNN